MVLFTLIAALQDAAVPYDAVPSSLAVAAHVSVVVIAVAVIALASMGLTLMARLNRAITELRRSARQSFGPVSDRARSISDNVEFMTQVLRTDVEKLNGSVQALTERLHHASERMEERVEEFNALMEVVQDEAEEIFLDTASTVRGVREGARSISGSSRRSLQARGCDGRDVDSRAALPDDPSSNAEEGDDATGGTTPLSKRHADASSGD